MNWPERLAGGEPITERVAIVVAHPDDETLFLGSLLHRLKNAVLIHLTDGAPDDMVDAARLGFDTREDYAAARAVELDRALRFLLYTGDRRSYRLPDKRVVHHLDALVPTLVDDLRGAAVVLTHPYEGGHPDHDAAALAVSRVARVPVVEFSCYCAHDGEREWARFWPGPREYQRLMTPSELTRTGMALVAHASQADVFGSWHPRVERWRAAPAYDFRQPPPPAQTLYDGYGWSLDSAEWRRIAFGEPAADGSDADPLPGAPIDPAPTRSISDAS